VFFPAFVPDRQKKSEEDDIAENRKRDSPDNASQQHGEYGFLSKFAEFGQYLS